MQCCLGLQTKALASVRGDRPARCGLKAKMIAGCSLLGEYRGSATEGETLAGCCWKDGLFDAGRTESAVVLRSRLNEVGQDFRR